MSRYTRKEWGARARRHHPGTLDPDDVVGIALHWPAMGDTRMRTPIGVMAGLRSWQNLHMDDRGWSDIAYQEAIDQEGNTYVLRGLRHRSAANGDERLNSTHGAILLVLGEGERPSAAMVKAVRSRVARHRVLFPNSDHVDGHGDLKSTTCPGPIVQTMIDAGEFDPKGGR
jgi:hypothetical protein